MEEFAFTEMLEGCLASIPYLEQLAEYADSLTARRALDAKTALETLKQQLDATLGLVKGETVRALESPVQVGEVVYYRRPTGKWRPDQRAVSEAVVRMASIDRETGEILDGPTSAERAVRIMASLYVAPSSMPKEGGLQGLGLERRDVASWERTGWEIATKAVTGGDDE